MPISGSPRKENPKHANERFLTPLELCHAALRNLPKIGDYPFILDPGCGSGHWGIAARDIWPTAYIVGVDIDPQPGFPKAYDRFYQSDFRDYLPEHGGGKFDYVIGNPPFSMAATFIRTSMRFLSPGGWLVFVLEITYMNGQGRYKGIHREYPVSHFDFLPERPSFSGDGKTAVGREYGVFYLQNSPVAFGRLPTWGFLDWSGKLG